MKKSIKIKEVMTPMPYTIGTEQTLKTVKSVMSKNKIRHLPVLNGGTITGVISERDIYFALALEDKNDSELKVTEVIYPELYTVSGDTSLAEVLEHMGKNKIGSTLIVEDDKVIGIYTAVDVCIKFADYLKS